MQKDGKSYGDLSKEYREAKGKLSAMCLGDPKRKELEVKLESIYNQIQSICINTTDSQIGNYHSEL